MLQDHKKRKKNKNKELLHLEKDRKIETNGTKVKKSKKIEQLASSHFKMIKPFQKYLLKSWKDQVGRVHHSLAP